MIGQEDPGGEQKAPPRTRGIEAARQTGKVPLHHIPARRQQSDSKKEKAVRKERAPQPGHEGQCTGPTLLFQAYKPQTQKRGLRYPWLRHLASFFRAQNTRMQQDARFEGSSPLLPFRHPDVTRALAHVENDLVGPDIRERDIGAGP